MDWNYTDTNGAGRKTPKIGFLKGRDPDPRPTGRTTRALPMRAQSTRIRVETNEARQPSAATGRALLPAPLQTAEQPIRTMPYLKIQTNLPLTKKAQRAVLKEASTLVSEELGKPEEYVMLALQPDTPMLFSGTDDPVAFLELKSIGLQARQTKRLSATLCGLVERHLGISKERIYVKFIDVARGMWGWKGDTF